MSNSNNGSRLRPWLRRADQAAIAGLVLFACVAIGGYWYTQAVIRHRLVEFDQVPSETASFQVDLNSADWPELVQLPSVGQKLAHEIVEWRTKNGPFKQLEDLRHVHGIGPKTFARIKPFLRPIGVNPPPADVATESTAAAGH